MDYNNVLKAENTALLFQIFTNGNGVQKLVVRMPDDWAFGEWELPTFEDIRWNENHQRPIKYWIQVLIQGMRWLMRERAYGDHPIYTPQSCGTAIPHRNASIKQCSLQTGGGRKWNQDIEEDHHMLIDVKSKRRLGDTLVPVLLMSDETYCSNSAGIHKEWPVWMTMGNLFSKICQMHCWHCVVLVTLLVIPINTHTIHQERVDEQWQSIQEVLKPRQVPPPHTFEQSPTAGGRYYSIHCADGNFRRCKSVLDRWLADCPEDCDLQHLEWHFCF